MEIIKVTVVFSLVFAITICVKIDNFGCNPELIELADSYRNDLCPDLKIVVRQDQKFLVDCLQTQEHDTHLTVALKRCSSLIAAYSDLSFREIIFTVCDANLEAFGDEAVCCFLTKLFNSAVGEAVKEEIKTQNCTKRFFDMNPKAKKPLKRTSKKPSKKPSNSS